MGVCCPHANPHQVHAVLIEATRGHQIPWRPEEGIVSPGTGIRDSWEPPCVRWESNPGPVEEQLMSLTTEPSLLLYFETVSCVA